jgi:hypothetical protein
VRRVVVLLLVSVASGCGMREVANIKTPYVTSEYLPYAQPGSASIVAGTVADRRLGGRAMTCAGMDVELMPATAYTRESVAIYRGGKLPSGRASSDHKTLLRSVIKQATCDGSGHFAFDKLAAGTWIVGMELRAGDGDAKTGALFREIAIAPGEAATVTFADADFIPR